MYFYIIIKSNFDKFLLTISAICMNGDFIRCLFTFTYLMIVTVTVNIIIIEPKKIGTLLVPQQKLFVNLTNFFSYLRFNTNNSVYL